MPQYFDPGEYFLNIPDGVYSAHFDVCGAEGGIAYTEGNNIGELGGTSGKGARVQGILQLIPNQTLTICVAGKGNNGNNGSGGSGGFNGGGAGAFKNVFRTESAGGGGGVSEIILNGSILVAAGGGGGAGCATSGSAPGQPFNRYYSMGGDAAFNGLDGTDTTYGGKGGSTTLMEVGAAGGGEDATPGVGKQGGNGGQGTENRSVGAGGGGGYFGGGGGGSSGSITPGGGGGGGSSFGPVGSSFTSGFQSNNGKIIIDFIFVPAICVFPGALVQTPSGSKKIEDIQKGDLVLTDFQQEIQVINNVKSLPTQKGFTRLTQGSLGDQLPSQDIIITDGHPIRLPNSQKEVPVEELANDRDIIRKEGSIPETYSLITKDRLFVMMNNIPVCTWSQDRFQRFAEREQLKYELL